jgi:acyl-CoA synthetase (AMP-forming)/AMP-acid ligase II
MQIGEMIRRAARLYGDAPAVSCEGRTLSFREFDAETDRVGNALLAKGLRPGDRVGVLLPNGIEVLVAYYALAKNGLVRLGLNSRETIREHAHKISDSGARAIIGDGSLSLDVEMTFGLEDLARMARDGAPTPCVVDREMDAPLRMGYTGGTTGKSKGVVLTTRGELAEVVGYCIDYVPDIRRGDTMLHASPIAHASGSFFLPHLLRGAQSVIMPKFDPGKFIELAEREHATTTFAVPTMIVTLFEQAGLATAKLALRRLCYGAAPIAPAVAERAQAVFGNVLAQTYGQTEAPMTIACLQPEDHGRVGSAGRPYTLVEVRIVDEEDRPVSVGQTGEVCARGEIVMKGYWNNPEATAKTLRGGWLHTGDIGRLDEDGFLYLVDRKNDLLISGGFNVYPREVEDVLLSLPGVREAAVVGLPDEKWGDRIHAVVAGSPGLDGRELLESLRGNIASYKRPRGLDVWPELPKSAAGKILRREVRDRLIAAQNKHDDQKQNQKETSSS